MKTSLHQLLLRIDLLVVVAYLISFFAGDQWLVALASALSWPGEVLWTILLFGSAVIASWARNAAASYVPDKRLSSIVFELIVLTAVVLVTARMILNPAQALAASGRQLSFVTYALVVVVVAGAGSVVSHFLFRLFFNLKNNEN